jgi:S-phase kinase-associated protein 1
LRAEGIWEKNWIWERGLKKMSEDQITLVTNDDKRYSVLLRVANMSKTIVELMKDNAHGDIFLSVTGVVLEHVVRFCMHHIDDVAIVPAPDPPLILSTWDIDFCKVFDEDGLFDLIHAANYLDIKPLIDTCCQYVANSLVGKTKEELYALFKEDENAPILTTEQEKEILRENPWLED